MVNKFPPQNQCHTKFWDDHRIKIIIEIVIWNINLCSIDQYYLSKLITEDGHISNVHIVFK